MVLGRLEPEASPHWSQASSLSAEEIVVVYHERTKHHYHRFAWIGLRSQIRSVATRERRWFAFRDGASTSILAALRRRQHGASRFRFTPSLFFRYALSLTAWKRFHETTRSIRADTYVVSTDVSSCGDKTMQRIPNESLDLRELVVEQVPASSMMPEPTTAITPSASTAHGSDRNTLFHPLVVVVGLDRGVQCSPNLVL